MDSFGKKLRDCREQKGLSQNKLAQAVALHHSIIGRYEREEAKPTIDVVKRLANALGTTVSYLLGENETGEIFKSPEMLERFKTIVTFSKEEQNHILYTIDAMIDSIKLKMITKS